MPNFELKFNVVQLNVKFRLVQISFFLFILIQLGRFTILWSQVILSWCYTWNVIFGLFCYIWPQKLWFSNIETYPNTLTKLTNKMPFTLDACMGTFILKGYQVNLSRYFTWNVILTDPDGYGPRSDDFIIQQHIQTNWLNQSRKLSCPLDKLTGKLTLWGYQVTLLWCCTWNIRFGWSC